MTAIRYSRFRANGQSSLDHFDGARENRAARTGNHRDTANNGQNKWNLKATM
jgi:hypothetical protein